MTRFHILHLTDLHYGLTGQEALFPNIREDFFADLDVLLNRVGAIDIVLFSGDLVQSGAKEQFVRLAQLLEALWKRLRVPNSPDPILLAVPGNHDIARPKPNLPEVVVLQDLATTNRAEVWEDLLRPAPAGRYRKVLDKAFREYRGWWDACPYTGKGRTDFQYDAGPLPGDFSAALEKDGARLGIIGLNSTFLQLTGGDYQGKLALSLNQFHQATKDKGAGWFQDNIDACLLMTHQPPDWLVPANRSEIFSGEIDIPGRFAAHFCGHMHVPSAEARAQGWSQPRRVLRGGSLFGLETHPDGSKQRIHGYAVCSIELPAGAARGSIRAFPRIATRQSGGHLRFDRDVTFNLARESDDGGTPAEEFERLRSPSMGDNQANGTDSPTTISTNLSVDRDAFLNALSGLSAIDFEKIILRLPGARGNVSDQAPVEKGVNQLIVWAESTGGPVGKLEAVYRVFHRLFPNVPLNP